MDLSKTKFDIPLMDEDDIEEPITPDFVIEDGKSQPFVDTNNLIHEEVWVEAPVDSDHDGKRDLVYIKITRPSEGEYGLKSPAILDPTPYDSTLSNLCNAFANDPAFPHEQQFAGDGDWYNWYIMQDPDMDYPGTNNPDTTNLTYQDIMYTNFHTHDDVVAHDFNPPWLPAQREAESIGEANRINAWLSATNWKQYFISRGYAALGRTAGIYTGSQLSCTSQYPV